MTDVKIYNPEEIADNPLPGEQEEVFAVTQQTAGGELSTEKIKDQDVPTKRIAVELMSSALNTKSKKILAEFEFTEQGAIKIGSYSPGESGDIRITPNGITARDENGVTTFALDGLTGDAVFKGTVQAGSVISGGEIIGGSININDAFTVDSNGNVIASSATFNQYFSKSEDGQILSGSILTGNSNVKIDGANKRIIINDGTNDRILIGYQSGGF